MQPPPRARRSTAPRRRARRHPPGPEGAPRALGAVFLAAFVAILASGGCAAALTDPPPAGDVPEHQGAPECTDTPGLSVADATLSLTYLQLGAWWLVSWESELLPAPPPHILIPIFGLAGAHAGSALYGYNQVLRCKDAQWTHRGAAGRDERAADGVEERRALRPPAGGELHLPEGEHPALGRRTLFPSGGELPALGKRTLFLSGGELPAPGGGERSLSGSELPLAAGALPPPPPAPPEGGSSSAEPPSRTQQLLEAFSWEALDRAVGDE